MRVVQVCVALLAAIALGELGSAPASVAASRPVYTQAAHSGSYWGATSTTSPSAGGIFQDRALNTSAGQLVCASAWLRTQFPNVGAAGKFVIWLIGGTKNENGVANYSGLGNLGSWAQAQTCVEATVSHTAVRIQFYPNPGSPTVDMDDIDVHVSLAANGGFEVGSGASWAPYPNTGSNYVDYAGAAHSGSRFGATNTSHNGGGIFQDVALNTTPGQVICGSAWLRNEGSARAAAGQFVLWLVGGTKNENGVANYSGLGNGSNWRQFHTCVEATVSHTDLRIQFYPKPGSSTVEIDDVDVHRSLAANGGFEVASGASWAPYPNTGSNYVDYAGAAHSGSRFGATNTSHNGGGIFQDVALNTTPGQVICGSAWLRNEGSATAAAGQFVLWLVGGTKNENGVANYSGLGNGSNWRQFHTCVEATVSHTDLRIQFYPKPGSSTVEIDDVDVHASLAVNGGFEFGSAPWGTYPGTDTSYAVDRTGLVYGPAPPAPAPSPPRPVVTTPVTVRLPVPKGRHALKVKVFLSWTWNRGVTRLDKVRVARHPARTRLTLRCLGRHCPHPAQTSAVGRRPLRRMLRAWKGRRFRAGERLIVTLTAPGFRREKASVRMRFGRRPRVKLL